MTMLDPQSPGESAEMLEWGSIEDRGADQRTSRESNNPCHSGKQHYRGGSRSTTGPVCAGATR